MTNGWTLVQHTARLGYYIRKLLLPICSQQRVSVRKRVERKKKKGGKEKKGREEKRREERKKEGKGERKERKRKEKYEDSRVIFFYGVFSIKLNF
jgi:hypothetical protein